MLPTQIAHFKTSWNGELIQISAKIETSHYLLPTASLMLTYAKVQEPLNYGFDHMKLFQIAVIVGYTE